MKPLGPFPPTYHKGALAGAYRRGYAAGERGEKFEDCPYDAHTRCSGLLYRGKSWGFQLGEAWCAGRDDGQHGTFFGQHTGGLRDRAAGPNIHSS